METGSLAVGETLSTITTPINAIMDELDEPLDDVSCGL
jgi:hypothetical protein